MMNQQPFGRLLRMEEVTRITGYSRSNIYRLMKKGKFPLAKQLSRNAVAWLDYEVEAWIQNLPAFTSRQIGQSKNQPTPAS